MPIEYEIVLPKLHSGQELIFKQAQRYNVVRCGRRWGKTKSAIRLLTKGHAPHDKKILLAGQPIGWFAPQYKLLDEAYRECCRVLGPIITSKNQQQKRIECVGGGSIDFWTLEDSDAGRGRKYARVILDEAAMSRNLQEAWEQSIRPTLTDLEGDAWFMSTPKRGGFFKVLCARGDKLSEFYEPGWMSWHMPTLVNPHINPDEIEEARRTLPDAVFRQEYLAEFVESDGNIFRRDWIKWYQTELPAQKMNRVLLVDPAGAPRLDKSGKERNTDYTVIVVLGLHEDGNYYVLDFVRERIGLSDRIATIMALHRTYKPQTVGYEKYGMQSDIEALEAEQDRQSYRFNVTELGGSMKKEDRIIRIEPLFSQSKIWFPGVNVCGSEHAHRALKLWIETEYASYPDSDHDDGLDVLARVFDVPVKFPKSADTLQQLRQKQSWSSHREITY